MTEPANVAPADRGFEFGDGLFETVLFKRGRPVLFEAHMDRLERGCEALGLPPPDRSACAAAARRALMEAGLQDRRAAVRLSWTAGSGDRGLERAAEPEPRLHARAAPSAKPDEPVALATVSVRRNPTSPTARLKTLSYLDNVMARAEARREGADEALMLDLGGHVACAAAANVFWLASGSLFTPALSCGVLDGVMRGVVLDAADGARIPAREVEAAPSALLHADAVFLTNSLIGARRVLMLDDHPLSPGAIPTVLLNAAAAVS